MGAHASDAVPVQSEPDTASISAAKQQLEQMKSAGAAATAGVDTKLTPQLPVTQLNLGNDYTAPAAPTKRDNLRRQRSDNWLVDGVMKQERSSRDGQDRRSSLDPQNVSHPLGNNTLLLDESDDTTLEYQTLGPDNSLQPGGVSGESPSAAIARSTSSAATEKPPPVDNFDPFAKFMNDWLSPQDLALAKASSALSAPGDAPAGTPSAALPIDSATPSQSGGIDAFTASGATGAGKLGDNPFLQFLKTPDAAPLPPPPPVETAPAPVLPTTPPSLSDTTSKSVIPDFAKPGADDGNWKPLKRF